MLPTLITENLSGQGGIDLTTYKDVFSKLNFLSSQKLFPLRVASQWKAQLLKYSISFVRKHILTRACQSGNLLSLLILVVVLCLLLLKKRCEKKECATNLSWCLSPPESNKVKEKNPSQLFQLIFTSLTPPTPIIPLHSYSAPLLCSTPLAPTPIFFLIRFHTLMRCARLHGICGRAQV